MILVNLRASKKTSMKHTSKLNSKKNILFVGNELKKHFVAFYIVCRYVCDQRCTV